MDGWVLWIIVPGVAVLTAVACAALFVWWITKGAWWG